MRVLQEEIKEIILEARGEEVKQLRQVVEDKEEKIKEMEVGMMEKNSEKEWELMGTKLLVEQMKEETTRRDEAVEKGVAGIVQPELEEKVVAIKKGDALALPFGVVTWWYNKEETELVVPFLGDTLKAHKAEAPLDVDIKGGGRVVVLNTQNLPLVDEVGLGADLVRLDGKAMCSPGFSCDSTL
ncbi:hypothetical protein RJT34_22544 [Clitoria ternatea]|uniref:Uncharacterized protein n=1 Tax=Clitoria ternatea TaxID=43366 RepID=A0AAN9FQD7_CLITE